MGGNMSPTLRFTKHQRNYIKLGKRRNATKCSKCYQCYQIRMKDFKDSNMLKKKNAFLMNWKELIKAGLKVVRERQH